MKRIVSGMCLAIMTLVATAKEAALEQALAQAGDNKVELEKALSEAPAGQKKAMQFLISHMPERDLKSLKADYLLKNVAWAYKARETFPWAKKVPEDVFFNDVLPYASLNERRDDWREDFFNRFSKYVKDAKTQHEALMAVNKHIIDEVKVKYSTKRKKADQSPYESMEQGLASCTGLSILLNNAFRAVGIPSRVAGTPAWTTKRGNHNWVEVWTTDDKQWHFTEYYLDKKGIDHGWLLADAARGNAQSLYHSIYASSWKPTGKYFPLVWDMKIKYVHAVNVTDRYIKLGGVKDGEDVCELRIHLMKDGKRIEVPVGVAQGDAMLGEGNSPKATDDMNRYFTVKARKGQLYTVAWKDPETGKVVRKMITTPKDKEWLTLNLAEEE
ncbi:transglutaminase-like domain-containing protein [Oceaniferula spumae]